MVVTEGLEQRLDKLYQRLDEEVEEWQEVEAKQRGYEPKGFPKHKGELSGDETPGAVDMSLDSPTSLEEAGAGARSPSPDPTYEPEEEARILLDQAAGEPQEESIEVKAESPVYVAPGSSLEYMAPGLSPGSLQGRSPSPLSTLYNQVRGKDPPSHPGQSRGGQVKKGAGVQEIQRQDQDPGPSAGRGAVYYQRPDHAQDHQEEGEVRTWEGRALETGERRQQDWGRGQGEGGQRQEEDHGSVNLDSAQEDKC